MVRQSGIDGVLPWGWWLRVIAGSIEDTDGRTWQSVRQAFWEGHLGFPNTRVDEQLELLLRVLSNASHGWVGSIRLVGMDEAREDLFGGDMLFWRFYQCWLSSVGLLASGPGIDPLCAGPSDEGRSVLLMLEATREPEWIQLPFAAVLEAVRNADRTVADDDRERALRTFEGSVTRMRHVFAREGVAGLPSVTLTGLDTATRMPIRKVVWSQAFRDQRVRDDFFAWLAERVHRWEDWGKLAHSKGADALTRHLLGLFAAGLSGS